MSRKSRQAFAFVPLDKDDSAPPLVIQPRIQMVQCLLSLKVPSKHASAEEEARWEERLCSSLVRGMHPRTYDELLKAIASRGTQPTKCVFIKKYSIL